MIILNQNLEKLLKRLIDLNQDEICIRGDFCQKTEIDELIRQHYFKYQDISDSGGWYYIINPTQQAKYYFENKEKFLHEEKQREQKDNKRYWITTGIAIMSGLISLGALIVAIIALCK